MNITEATVDALKAKWGEVWIYTRGPFTFALRCPEHLELRRYTISVAEDRKNTWDAQERLALHAVIYPEGESLKADLAKRPGLIPWLAAEAASIASELEGTDAKKA